MQHLLGEVIGSQANEVQTKENSLRKDSVCPETQACGGYCEDANKSRINVILRGTILIF